MTDPRYGSAPAVRSRGAGGDTWNDAEPAENCTTAAAAGNPPVTTAPFAPMMAYRQWVSVSLTPDPARPGKTTKRPINPRTGAHTSVTDPAAWGTYAEADARGGAVGFVLTDNDPFWCLDIDGCLQPDGQWSPLALTLVQRLAGCAVEVSASGKGLHIWGSGPLPDHGCRNTALGIELYHKDRFVCLGTNALGSAGHTPPPDVWQWLVPTYFPPRAGGAGGDRGADWTDGPCPEWRGPADDADLLRRAMRSQSGKAALFGKAGFADLWEGRTDVLAATYPADASGSSAYNASSADAALAQHLAFWTGRDCARIERLMRQSALVREKWDAREDYLPRTILNAVAGCRDVLQDREVEPVAAVGAPPALPPGKPRFQSRTPDDLDALPPVKYRTKGVLPETGIAALYGPPGSGKTFVALDAGFTVAGDAPAWFKHRVKPAPVTYVALEGEAGIAQRVKAWQKHHGKAPGRFRVVTGAMDIRREADRAELAEIVLQADMAGGVLIIDTLNQAAPGADENASTDMGLIVAALKDLQARLGGLVLVVHHSGKDATRGMRGHSSLLAALDACIEVTRDGDRREWKVAKAKDGIDGTAHPFRLQVIPLGFDEDGEPITSCVITPDEMPGEAVRRAKVPKGGQQKIIWAALTEMLEAEERRTGGRKPEGAPDDLPLGRPCLRLEDVVLKCRDRLAVAPDRKTERTRSAITGLITLGLLECREGWLWKI